MRPELVGVTSPPDRTGLGRFQTLLLLFLTSPGYRFKFARESGKEFDSRRPSFENAHHADGRFGAAGPDHRAIQAPEALIGEGGFGSVFLAEQREPVRRNVALKIIKPGMDTRGIIARFEAKRQALALMDHPHIAKVFDAGATDAGRPYFVMELVTGEPITQYCDSRRLTIRERLILFAQVCGAVQHAHTKGIIHRGAR